MRDFNCTRCGACCARVLGEPARILRGMGWVLPNGACKQFDPATRDCKAFETRPSCCRVDESCPPQMTLAAWRDFTARYCDMIHEQNFGIPREQDGVCHHVSPWLELLLETVTTCNAACHFCPYSKLRDRHGNFMSWELFTKIVDESADIPQIQRFVLNGLGEPLLDLRLADRIRYIRTKKPHSYIILHTNGVLMTPARLESLLAAGLEPGYVSFSLNATTQEQHEKVMGIKGRFDQVCGHIDYARARVRTNVTALVNFDNFTQEHVAAFLGRWGMKDQGGIGLCLYEKAWGGLNRTIIQQPVNNEPCPRALSQMMVLYDGTVTMCCVDPIGKLRIFGNLSRQTIREVYNSKEYTDFRVAHFEHRANDVVECRGCMRP